MENLYPPQPKTKNGKMARFGFCAASSLIWGGWGFAVPFYSVQDCRSRSVYFASSSIFFNINDIKRMSHHGISFAVSSFHPLRILLSSYLIFPVHRLVPLTFHNEQFPARGLGLARTDSTKWLRYNMSLKVDLTVAEMKN